MRSTPGSATVLGPLRGTAQNLPAEPSDLAALGEKRRALEAWSALLTMVITDRRGDDPVRGHGAQDCAVAIDGPHRCRGVTGCSANSPAGPLRRIW